MPRPRKNDPRDIVIPLRVNVAEDTLLRAGMRATGIRSRATYMRRTLFANAAAGPPSSIRFTIAAPPPAPGSVQALHALLGLPSRSAAPPPQPEIDLTPELALQLWHELRRIGVNINQMARATNEFRPVPADELRAALAELRACLERVRPVAP